MPVYSMTGYASGQNGSAGSHSEAEARPAAAGRLGVEIRSVNSRFLDLTFKLPEELRQHETALRELLTGKLKRGKVKCGPPSRTRPRPVVEPSVKLLQRLNGVQDSIKAWLPSARDLSVADVLRLAGGDSAARGDQGPDLLDVAGKALEGLMLGPPARRRAAGQDARSPFWASCAPWRCRPGPLVPQLVEQQRTRFLERWQEAMGLTAGTGGTLPEAAQDRALTEATAFAIRIDVAEELTRLNSHLDEIERLLKKGGEIGKRLDFLIQELHREANTLGSKSAALELTRIGVDMKVLIEQMREQVQNIE